MKKFTSFFLVLLVTSFSCAVEDIEIKPQTGIRELTKTVDKSFVASFDPAYKKGMKFVYISKVENEPQETETAVEVLEIIGGSIKIKIEVGAISKEEQISVQDLYRDIPETSLIQSLGTETIKVPAGEFKDTEVITYYPDIQNGMFVTRAKITLWLVKDIGFVRKLEILPPNFKTIITELKEYIKAPPEV